MIRLRHLWPTSAVIFILFALFFTKCYVTIDPDLGWRLQTGKIILHSGIPPTDPFSYTMPSFPYVDHSYLSDAIIVLLSRGNGLLIPSIVIGLVALGTLFLCSRLENVGRWKYFPIILAGLIFFEFIALRPLALSWFFVALLVYLCWSDLRFRRYRLLLPVLFFLWANLHGGFASGIFILILKVTTEVGRTRKISVTNSIILFLCIAITLLNPYGGELWREVGSTLLDSSLHFTIAEWIPGIFSFDPITGVLAVVSSILLIRYRNAYSLFQILAFLFTLLSAITAVRNIPLWAIMAVPFTIKGLHLFETEVKDIQYGPERFIKVYRIFLIVISVFIGVTLFQGIYQIATFKESNYYPKFAITYLEKHPPKGNVFAPYGWGGYLVWNYPQKKVFIDGRMPSWEMPPTQKESPNAFREYQTIVTGQVDYKVAFNKFAVTTVVWPINQSDPSSRHIESYWQDVATKTGFFKRAPYPGTLIERLKKDNWKEVYRDTTSVIYIQSRI